MNIVDQMRPRAEHVTDEHSHAMLNSVIASPARRSKRRWNRLAAFGLFGVIVATGTAFSTGFVPEIVSDRFGQIHDGGDGWPHPVYDERQIADVELSNGKHARVWFGDTIDGQCFIRDMTGVATRPEDLGFECARWDAFDIGQQTDPRRGVHWQTSVAGPAVVYGAFAGVVADVARVDIAGPGWARSFVVEKEAFAGEVPAGAEGDRVRFSYVDRQGMTIANQTSTVGIESE